jgi:hypothetical protein
MRFRASVEHRPEVMNASENPLGGIHRKKAVAGRKTGEQANSCHCSVTPG